MQDSEKKELAKILKREMKKLTDLTENYASKDVAIHEMEMNYLRTVLSLCYNLLSFLIALKVEQKRDKKPLHPEGKRGEKKGWQTRIYMSLFGKLEFSRPSYWVESIGKIYVVDEDLCFPPDMLSYNLQELLGSNGSEVDYRESVRLINDLLGLSISGKASERNVNRLGQYGDAYYEQKKVVPIESPRHFSASFDGKGVPKIKKKKATEPSRLKRLGKGEKRGIMEMATVSVTSNFEPRQRSVESVLKGLMGSPLSKVEEDEKAIKVQPTNGWHQDVHRRAFLGNQAKSIDYGIKHIKDRIVHPDSRFVVPIDAGIGLEDKVLAAVEKYNLNQQFDGIILDIIHVSEYVWTAANAIFGETSKVRSAWVREMLEDLLNSKTTKVIEDLEKIVVKGKLSKNKISKVQKTITYFNNHQHKMDYKKFIEKGYPVSSALVESACGHLVKERMEQSGMRWSSSGAQHIMDIRAIKQNDDLVDFMDFVRRKDRQRSTKMVA